MNQSLQKASTENVVQFIPLGNEDPIKLSLGIIERQIANPTKSGKRPTQKEMMDFLMLCRARKLNPFEGDAYLVGYDSGNEAKFSLITSHQALLKRAELSNDFDGMESGLILDDMTETEGDFLPPGTKAIGAWARVHRKNRRIPTFRRLNIDKYNKNFGLWKNQAEMMAVKCAEADALRSAFPTTTGGLYIREEMPPESRQAEPVAALLEDDEDHDLGPTKPQRRKLSGKHDDLAREMAETSDSAPLLESEVVNG